jgi:site-specific recombinase XerD
LDGQRAERAVYAKDRAEGRLLERRLQEIESATRTGIARQEDIEDWITRKWLKPDEAIVAFPGYAESAERLRRRDVQGTDYDSIEEAYADYAHDHSKGGSGSDRNHQNAMSHARHALEWLRGHYPRLEDLERAGVETYRRELSERGFAPWTIYHRMTKMRLLLDRALELKMLPVNSARGIEIEQPKRLKTRRILTLDEIGWLLEASLKYRQWISGSVPTIARMGLYAGLRDIEMVWFTWDWIDWRQRILHIGETKCEATGQRWTPKTHERRSLDVKAEFIDYMRQERKRQEGTGLGNQFVLPAGNDRQDYLGKPLSQDAPQKAMRKMMVDEGRTKDDITLYALRHTYCTTLLRPPPNGAGLDIRTVQLRMGHSDIRTTEQYLRDIEPEKHPTDALPY